YRVGQRFGMGHVIDVLKGSRKERLLQLGHDRLSTYAIGADKSLEYWSHLLRHLIHQGFLEQDVSDYSVLKLKESAGPLLKGEMTLTMARPRAEKTAPAKSGQKMKGEMDYDRELFENLKALRKRLAEKAGVPPFVIFSDTSLAEMAAYLPQDTDDFRRIHGVGDHKLKRYGPDFLEEILRFTRSNTDLTGES
ncbi:MAG TPA: RQC domain-containing protein, partial [Deltaproteobacteria bacterium]|nr:RQC domain-containing protein [Deltaproteobacteria bacterium]